MEDREAARAERTANLATLQHLSQLATGHNNNHNPGGNGDGAPRSRLRDFQGTDPPIFNKCSEPLDADDWIRSIEHKLEIAGVGENEKVLYASHYLTGHAQSWWDTTRALLPPGEVVSWEDFKIKFRKRHVPTGLLSIMREKFLQLRQGGMSVMEYLDKFTTLAR